MIAPIEDNRDAIADLCRQYGVKKLAVFTSAVNGTFDPELLNTYLDVRVIVGMRNRLALGYADVDEEVIWTQPHGHSEPDRSPRNVPA